MTPASGSTVVANAISATPITFSVALISPANTPAIGSGGLISNPVVNYSANGTITLSAPANDNSLGSTANPSGTLLSPTAPIGGNPAAPSASSGPAGNNGAPDAGNSGAGPNGPNDENNNQPADATPPANDNNNQNANNRAL